MRRQENRHLPRQSRYSSLGPAGRGTAGHRSDEPRPGARTLGAFARGPTKETSGLARTTEADSTNVDAPRRPAASRSCRPQIPKSRDTTLVRNRARRAARCKDLPRPTGGMTSTSSAQENPHRPAFAVACPSPPAPRPSPRAVYQPLRYGGSMYWLASGTLVIFCFLASHSMRLPTRMAKAPSSSDSVITLARPKWLM